MQNPASHHYDSEKQDGTCTASKAVWPLSLLLIKQSEKKTFPCPFRCTGRLVAVKDKLPIFFDMLNKYV
jgi:hypothetical protein